MTKLLASLALGVAVFALAGCDVVHLAAQQSQVRGTFDRDLTVSGPVEFDVQTGSGDVQIRVGQVDRIHVVGRIQASESWVKMDPDDVEARVKDIEAHPPIEQTGSVVRLGNTGGNPLFRNVSISYEVTVPPETRIHSQTGSGDQSIGSVRGSVSAQSGSGDITIAESGGEVRVRTGSGEISIERAGGGLEAQAGSGDIRADRVAGPIRAQTGSGDIEVAQAIGADVNLQSGSGDVTLGLAPNAGYDLNARAGSGSIHVNRDVSSRSESRHYLDATIGGGGAKVNVTTHSGSIEIR